MKKIISMVVIAAHLAGCASYKSQSVPFRPPEAYGNFFSTAGVSFGAEAYADPAGSAEIFGYDVRRAGLLPVQLVVDNRSTQGVEVIAGQTFLVDEHDRYWKMLTTREAIGRVEKATEMTPVGKGAGKGAVVGAMAGTMLGLALGVLSGKHVGTAALRGAAIGGAGGAVIGGASQADAREQEVEIATDLNDKRVEGRVFPAAALNNGFMFFPGECPNAKELRMQVRFRATGEITTLMLPLKPGGTPRVLQMPAAPSTLADG